MALAAELARALMEGNGTTAPPALSVPKAWKLGILPALFFVTLVPSIGPWFLLCFCSKKNLAMSFSFAGCLAAGILLGAGLCNILPEASENWNDYFSYRGISNRLSGYPFGQLIAGTVVLLLVSLEHLLISAGASHSHKHDDEGGDDSDAEEAPGETTPILTASMPHANKAAAGNGDAHTEKKDKKDKKDKHHHHNGGGDQVVAPEHGTKEGHKPHEHAVPEWHNKQEHHHHQRRIVTVIVFALAFCLHGLADGLALGATNNRAAFVALTAAAFSHKFLDGFALGVPVQKAELRFVFTAGILTFASAMTPLGILIGMALTSADAAGSYLARAIILSFSSGSFLFLSLLELLPASLSVPKRHRLLKLAFVFVGFAAMAALATLEDRSRE